MKLLKSIKGLGKNIVDSVERIGLDAEEQYKRAYLKGVNVQDWGSAAKDFHGAYKKFQSEKINNDIVLRAQANSKIYGLIHSKDRSNIDEVIEALEVQEQIEKVGTEGIFVPAKQLIAELKAIQLEYQADLAQSQSEKGKLYLKAAELLKELGDEDLLFADKIGILGPIDKALLRAHYYDAFSNYYNGLAEVMISPAHAHELFIDALEKSMQAGATDLSSEIENHIDYIKVKRHCWMCGREMQGRNTHFKYYPTNVAPYHKKLLESSGDDVNMLDTADSVTLCSVCGSVIEKQADIYAAKKADEVFEKIKPLLNKLANRLNDLEYAQSALENAQGNLEGNLERKSSESHTQRHYDTIGNYTGESITKNGETRHYNERGSYTGSSQNR